MTLLSDPREASGRDVASGGSTHSTDLTDARLLASVREGDSSAYAMLYELHADAVRRLARRLCRDPHEADDVVSEVFANTLRAIRNGGGPRDEFALYALRSVRNTVTKLRTRTDTAHATPSETDVLDRPDVLDPYHLAGDVELAFAELPERFRRVLWTTAVEGHTPTELAGEDGTPLDAGAVASLSQRARKALGRSYLRVRTNRPARHPDCNRVRGYLPGYVQHTTGAGTAERIEAHLALCTDCAQIRDEMHELNGKLRTIPWLALLAAAARRAVMGVAGAGMPAVATAAAAPIVVLAVTGTVIVRHHDEPATRAAVTAEFAAADPVPAADTPTEALPVGPAGSDTEAPPPGDDTPGPIGLDAVAGPSVDHEVVPVHTFPPSGPDVAPPPADPDLINPAGAPVGIDGLPGVPSPDDLGVGDGVVGAVTEGVTTSVVPAATAGVGTLLGDVDATVDDVAGVVGAVPNGLPAVLTETGHLVDGVGTTLNNTTTALGEIVDAGVQTLDATVTTVVATVDATATGLTGNVESTVTDVVDVDPTDPVGDLVGDLLGPEGTVDNVVGEGGTVDTLVGGLGLGGSGCLLFCTP